MLRELLSTLIQAVIVAAVPLLTTYLVRWLDAKSAQALSRMENEKARTYIADVAEAVSTAVTYTSQTYVDTLRKTGSFTLENQQTALSKARETALATLSGETIEFLNRAYGDASTYLETKIEQEVRTQKTQIPSISEATVSE